MRTAFVLLVLIASTATAGGLSKAEAFLVAATSLDLISTEVGLAQGRPEVNPVMRNRRVRIALNVAQVAFSIVASRKLRDSGHPRLATAVLWAPIVTHSAATGWNVYFTLEYHKKR